MRQADSPDANVYESMELLHSRYSREREHQLADSFQLHLAGVAHCRVGIQWGADGKLQSDHLHHLDIGLSGLREVEHLGKRHVLRPGDIWLLPGNTPVRLKCREPAEAVFFAFSCEWLPGIDPLLDWTEREPRLAGTCNVADWRGWLESSSDITVTELLRLRGMLVSWVASAIPGLEALLARHLQQRNEFTAVFDLVRQRPGADLNLSALAKAYGSPVKSFSRKFIRSMGMKPSDYLAMRVNQEALHWVSNTDLRLKEIAEKLRFTDEFYFSRFFKKHNGMSPADFRKRMRQR